MNLRLVVGGLMVRDAVLGTLLVNYANLLQMGPDRAAGAPAPWYIVPSWADDERLTAEAGGQLLTVEIHAPRDAPSPEGSLDAVLQLLQSVLSSREATTAITARFLGLANAGPSGEETVRTAGTWVIAPTPIDGPRRPDPRDPTAPSRDLFSFPAAGPRTAELN